MKKPSEYLGENGPFCESIEGYQVRDSQLGLCDAIEAALQNNEVLIAEAGTGIGKTFAYLVPAVLSGKKVIVSTGTRHLQDQLFHTDIPKVLKALDAPIKTALLKGRANYLCLHRQDIAPHLGYINKQTQSQLRQVKEWSKLTSSGDISELAAVAEDAMVWSMVTSTTDNCLGGECDYWNDCHVVKARKQALDADVLVINHHLLLADMTLKEDGFSELLPGAEAFVIDEAHQLHDVATRFFGDTISSRQLISLAKDAVAEQVNDAPDMAEIREAAEHMETVARDFRLALGDSGSRQAWSAIKNKPSVTHVLAELDSALSALQDVLGVASDRSRALDQCFQRCQALLQRYSAFVTGSNVTKGKDESLNPGESILWYETSHRGFMLHATPVDVAAMFRKCTDNFSASWIFTSATLQVNKNFNHFSSGMGLSDFNSGVWDSPFNYKDQSLLYLPEGLPEPSDYAYTKQFIDKILPVLEASQGRAFLLFTSYRALNEAAELLQDKFSYPVFIQGELPKHQLLAQFRNSGNGILLGTSSFWEGVDVRGSALSCVVIDKLPFASPGDPVMQARIEAIKKAGGQPFMEYQIPKAVIALKQGAGRLIRDVMDHGVVVIGDPRINKKSYGRIFLNSLPPMPVTTQINQVETFFQDRVAESDLETACS